MLSNIQTLSLTSLYSKSDILTGSYKALASTGFEKGSAIDDRAELSGVSSLAVSMQMAEVNYSNSSTELAYRSNDNSLALKANRTVNFNLKVEKMQFEITLSAESLGMDATMFADKSEPITIKLKYNQSDLFVSRDIIVKKHKTLRTPEEIIQDLVEALTTAMRDPDKRTIIYKLDDEAIQSLIQSDPKMAKLFGELVMIMNAVNLMKEQSQGDRDYIIQLSGKGKPYTEITEEVDIQGFEKEISVNITITPPQSSDAKVTEQYK